jgi:GDP-L-fucose synthase
VSEIYVAGHTGLVGSAIVRALHRRGEASILTASHQGLDLRRQEDVERFFQLERPYVVILAAATVGGIMANSSRPADFIYDNLMIEANVIRAALLNGCHKLVMLGSSCIYPREAPQPITESALLSGPLELTNRAYAVAKIAGIELVRAYRAQYLFDAISLMPTNLYGPGDRYDLENSHVLPALIRRFHEAKCSGASAVTLWGTGSPRREFLHVDDLAEAVLLCLDKYESSEPINVGTGEDLSIAELASLVAGVVDYRGEIRFDSRHPDGTPRKVLDVSKIHALGWSATIGLEDGIRGTYNDFLENWCAASKSSS